mgnify:CR=1 FL=1
MNNKETNRNLKDTKLVAATKKKKLKENNEIPLKHGKLLTIILSIVTLIYVSPIFVVLMNSFKANTFVKTDTFAWPIGKALVGWANYIKGFTFGNYPFFKSVLYSFVITVLSTALILVCTSMAAWYIARVDSIVCKIVYYLFVFSMVVPFQMVMFTLSNTADSLGLNTPWTIPVIYWDLEPVWRCLCLRDSSKVCHLKSRRQQQLMVADLSDIFHRYYTNVKTNINFSRYS